MDLKTFLEHFDTIAEATGGIPKLRSLILDLAVRGKLVPQNPEDEPASILLERIREEKTELVKEGKIKKHLPVAPIKDTEIPYGFPKSWEYARFIDITSVITCGIASTPNYTNTGKPFLSAKNIKPYRFLPEEHKFVSELDYLKITQGGKPERNDILLTRVGAGIGEAAIINCDLEFAYYVSLTLIKPFHKHLNAQFILHWLNSPEGVTKALQNTYGKGVSQGNLNVNQVRQFIVPIPPLAEQKRIVEKVDELMGLCDRLSSAKQTRDNLRQKLRESAIASLMNAETDEELEKGWAIVRDNWCEVSQCPEDVDDLRRSVLQLAVQGKLVSQNSKDESAQTSLSEVALEKQKLIKAGKLKEFSSLPAINETKLPSLPVGWSYCYLQDLTVFGPRNGYSPKAVEHPTPVRSITLTATTSGKFNGQFFKYIDEEIEAESHLWLQPGDLLIQRSNTLAYVGTAAVYDQAPGKYIFPDLIMRIRLSEKVNVNYIHIFLNSRASKEHFQSNASGTSGTMPKINQKIVNSLLIPLPPLAEQKRIVAKVDELMKLCDKLEASLRQSQQQAESLAASAISHLTL